MNRKINILILLIALLVFFIYQPAQSLYTNTFSQHQLQIEYTQTSLEQLEVGKAVGMIPTYEYYIITIVLKVDTPENIAKEIHNVFTSIFKHESQVNNTSGSITVREVYVSKLLRDPSGRWIFKVYGKPDNIDKILSKYKEYVEQVIYKPKPETQPIKPLD